ncbi:MAG TPA: CoA-binding protein, partial [Chitinophagaceae bacterium]|nr:CoA-binding protein [Chitinophagaceae bacterium]
MKKYTLVMGASDHPERYSYQAILKLRKYGHPVAGIGRRNGITGDVSFGTEKEPFQGIDTVTLYLNPLHQQPYYEYLLALRPKRIIFNPGTENPEFEEMAQKQGIQTIEACTLVKLGTGQ